MNILLVEDDDAKSDRIKEVLHEEFGDGYLSIVSVRYLTAARQQLRNVQFDLMILDIALPELEDGDVRPHGGIELLREITGRAVYRRPTYVIGLTARPEVYDAASTEFGSELWSVTYFEQSSELWVDPICRRIRYILKSSEESRALHSDRADVCILVAVNTELRQMLENGWIWTRHEVRNDAAVYYESSFRNKEGLKKRAILSKTPLMGMSAASILAVKMGLLFQPRIIIMPGICAGDSEQVELGDLIVGNPIWDYGSGKHRQHDLRDEFDPAPYQLAISTRIRGVVMRLADDAAHFQSIRDKFTGTRPSEPSRLHIGPFASGAAVVANKKVFQEIQSGQHRKLVGLDMEAYGVISASLELPAPHPECLVIKGVSDFADIDKGDKIRDYAAHLSARSVNVLLEKYGL